MSTGSLGHVRAGRRTWRGGGCNTLLRIRVEARARRQLHAGADEQRAHALQGVGARCVADLTAFSHVAGAAHAAAQIAVALLLVARQVARELRQRHFIDAALELHHHVERHPIVVPTPGVELWMVGGAQVQVPVVAEQLQ